MKFNSSEKKAAYPKRHILMKRNPYILRKLHYIPYKFPLFTHYTHNVNNLTIDPIIQSSQASPKFNIL